MSNSMPEFLILMHGDCTQAEDDAGWAHYLARMRVNGAFEGGSAIGQGATFRKAGPPAEVSSHLVGYLKVKAQSLEAVQELLHGNPVYEAGGTIEVRHLPRD